MTTLPNNPSGGNHETTGIWCQDFLFFVVVIV